MGYRCMNCGLTSDNTAPCSEPACGFRVGRFEPHYEESIPPSSFGEELIGCLLPWVAILAGMMAVNYLLFGALIGRR